MATKKDLVEAYSFSRRRLVTAFVSGAPGGREVEPTRPGRAIVGGVALAVLLVAGGAVLGILKSPTTVEWGDEQLISEKETGADYLVLNRTDGRDGTELRPLLNITSAMLIFGAGVESTDVARSDIAEQDRGASIGILGAPATPPSPSDLVQTGWSACTGNLETDQPTGISVDLFETAPVTPTPDVTFAVRTESGAVYVVSQSGVGVTRGDGAERAYAYPVPVPGDQGTILNAVADDTTPLVVPDQWITLFPAGGALRLTTFGIEDGQYGKAWPGAGTVPGTGKAKIGDLLAVGDDRYLLTADQVVRLDEFSSAVYANLKLPGQRRAPIEVPQAPGDDVVPARDLPDADWPSTVKPAVQTSGQLCALLDVAPDSQAGVLLATGPAPESSDEPLAVGAIATTVESGHGAFVFSGDFEDGPPSSPDLVDDRGYRYPVGQGDEQTLLGYGDEPHVEVPDSWMGLFQDGVPLTVDAARCPPSADEGGGCQ